MLTEKGFTGLIQKIQRAEGTLKQLVQDAIEDSLAYAIDRQEQGHGLDLRRLSTLQAAAKGMKSVNGQRLSDYIKTCLVDGNGKPCIGWHEKTEQYKLLAKGTVASLPSFDTRGAWFDHGKEQKPKDDFSFSAKLESLLKLAERHQDKLSEGESQLINQIRSARLAVTVQAKPEGAMSPAEAAAAGVI